MSGGRKWSSSLSFKGGMIPGVIKQYLGFRLVEQGKIQNVLGIDFSNTQTINLPQVYLPPYLCLYP